MPTDSDVEAFYSGLAGRREELSRRFRAGWPQNLGGCGLCVLGGLALLIGVVRLGDRWSRPTAAVASAVGLAALAFVALGAMLIRRGQRGYEPIRAAVETDLMVPLAAFLVTGATLERPAPAECVEWRASLLFPKGANVRESTVARLPGRLSGLPVVVDEIVVRHRDDEDSGAFGGWVARFQLPFAVGGHLRVSVPVHERACPAWTRGFERLPEAEGRLGAPYEVTAAAPGVTPEGALEPTTSGVAVETLLTDALCERLRVQPRMQVAAAGRTLWVTVAQTRIFDPLANVALFDVKYGRQAAAAVAAVEAVAREVVRAGTGLAR